MTNVVDYLERGVDLNWCKVMRVTKSVHGFTYLLVEYIPGIERIVVFFSPEIPPGVIRKGDLLKSIYCNRDGFHRGGLKRFRLRESEFSVLRSERKSSVNGCCVERRWTEKAYPLGYRAQTKTPGLLP